MSDSFYFEQVQTHTPSSVATYQPNVTYAMPNEGGSLIVFLRFRTVEKSNEDYGIGHVALFFGSANADTGERMIYEAKNTAGGKPKYAGQHMQSGKIEHRYDPDTGTLTLTLPRDRVSDTKYDWDFELTTGHLKEGVIDGIMPKE